jgi:Hemerythrin HHE cation binding domain
MLGLLRRMLGQSTPAPQAPEARSVPTYRSANAPRAPAYDSHLIATLQRDHADLVHLFHEIGRLVEQRRDREIPAMLLAFKTRFEAHLIAENVRFYNYVEMSLQSDEENLALIRSFRREMNAIARGVVDFVKKYQRNVFDDVARRSFLSDYAAVGGLLTQRVEREEQSLYPLYQPS